MTGALRLFSMATLPSSLPGLCVLGSIDCVHVCAIVRLHGCGHKGLDPSA